MHFMSLQMDKDQSIRNTNTLFYYSSQHSYRLILFTKYGCKIDCKVYGYVSGQLLYQNTFGKRKKHASPWSYFYVGKGVTERFVVNLTNLAVLSTETVYLHVQLDEELE